ncbi:hypothetical protein J6590_083324 [Homalodisca vitripennis]|nr:hypothetical protein J6590_083324 [Homalodisca vitripennis]
MKLRAKFQVMSARFQDMKTDRQTEMKVSSPSIDRLQIPIAASNLRKLISPAFLNPQSLGVPAYGNTQYSEALVLEVWPVKALCPQKLLLLVTVVAVDPGLALIYSLKLSVDVKFHGLRDIPGSDLENCIGPWTAPPWMDKNTT